MAKNSWFWGDGKNMVEGRESVQTIQSVNTPGGMPEVSPLLTFVFCFASFFLSRFSCKKAHTFFFSYPLFFSTVSYRRRLLPVLFSYFFFFAVCLTYPLSPSLCSPGVFFFFLYLFNFSLLDSLLLQEKKNDGFAVGHLKQTMWVRSDSARDATHWMDCG